MYNCRDHSRRSIPANELLRRETRAASDNTRLDFVLDEVHGRGRRVHEWWTGTSRTEVRYGTSCRPKQNARVQYCGSVDMSVCFRLAHEHWQRMSSNMYVYVCERVCAPVACNFPPSIFIYNSTSDCSIRAERTRRRRRRLRWWRSFRPLPSRARCSNGLIARRLGSVDEMNWTLHTKSDTTSSSHTIFDDARPPCLRRTHEPPADCSISKSIVLSPNHDIACVPEQDISCEAPTHRFHAVIVVVVDARLRRCASRRARGRYFSSKSTGRCRCGRCDGACFLLPRLSEFLFWCIQDYESFITFRRSTIAILSVVVKAHWRKSLTCCRSARRHWSKRGFSIAPAHPGSHCKCPHTRTLSTTC